jgi:hypothetical protein
MLVVVLLVAARCSLFGSGGPLYLQIPRFQSRL